MKTIVTTVTDKKITMKIISTKKSAKDYKNQELTLKDFTVYEKGDSRISALVTQDASGNEIIFSSSSNAIADTLEMLVDVFEKNENAEPLVFSIEECESKQGRKYLTMNIK